jgi:hypothetical protein
MQEMSTAGPPWEAVLEVHERPPSMQKMSMAGPLRGGARGLGARTINVRNINGRPLGRRCRRSRSAHHQHKKR